MLGLWSKNVGWTPPADIRSIEGHRNMGLDGVELVMEIEEVFNVKIPDEVAEKMRYVGDVYQYLLDNQSNDVSGRANICLTAVTFYKLRRLWIAELHVNRGNLRPDTRTDSILPSLKRRKSGLGWPRCLDSSCPT